MPGGSLKECLEEFSLEERKALHRWLDLTLPKARTNGFLPHSPLHGAASCFYCNLARSCVSGALSAETTQAGTRFCGERQRAAKSCGGTSRKLALGSWKVPPGCLWRAACRHGPSCTVARSDGFLGPKAQIKSITTWCFAHELTGESCILRGQSS